MSQLTSHLVEPSAYADSFSRVGTVRNTSRITEEMKGMTLIASTMPAVSMPMPIGCPWNSAPTTGSVPRCSLDQGVTYVVITGTSTNRPHMPETIAGLPDSISMAVPTGTSRQPRHETCCVGD